MKLFFEICKEFFDLLYLPFVSDIIENEIIKEEFEEELDEEKGFNEKSYKEDSYIEESYIKDIREEQEKKDYEHIQNDEQENNQYIQEKQDNEENNYEDVCSCEFFIQTLSIINARIYKQLNDNKSE
jgi:hypothetical protein